CIVEASFSIADYKLESLFEAYDLDYDPQSIVRREILPSGKSRAFVNDTPVKLRQLSALGDQLVDIHSQHETLFVGNHDYQYRVIDALAGNENLWADYKQALQEFKDLQEKLAKLEKAQQEAQKTYDYHLFLLRELHENRLESGMQENLEEEQEQLAHVEELKAGLSESIQQLQQEDLGGIAILQEVKNRLNSLENFGKPYKNLSERMKSVLVEVEDMSFEMENLFEETEADPQALEQVNEKMQRLYDLQKKHRVDTVEDLLAVQTDLEQKISTSEHAEAATAQLKKKIDAAEKKAAERAGQLCEKRKSVLPGFMERVKEILQTLGMPEAQLKIELSKAEAFNRY